MNDRLFLSSDLLAQHDFTGIFSLRHGGVSITPFDSLNLGLDIGDDEPHVQENLGTLLKVAGIPTPHQAIQVHGTGGLMCQGDGYVHQEEADILIGAKPACAVGVRTADCLPVLLADLKTGMIAAVHAGWRGTAKCIAKAAIKSLCSHGSQAEHILACIGPCIGPCCFEVDEATAEQLADSCSEAEGYIKFDKNFHADLAAINRLQLLRCGVEPHHIEHIKACTSCLKDDFFSYRRDGEQTGRHLAIVAGRRAP